MKKYNFQINHMYYLKPLKIMCIFEFFMYIYVYVCIYIYIKS